MVLRRLLGILSFGDRATEQVQLENLVDAIKATLAKTPPELSSDIMDRGIMLAGGGSLLQGLCERLRQETQIPVELAESPLTCVAVGAGMYLDEIDTIARSKRQPRARARR